MNSTKGGMMSSKIAIYPGTFDPITNGHFDIIERSLNLFGKVIIAVALSKDKQTMFTLDERVAMVKKCVSHLLHVEVIGFDNLTVEIAKEFNATALIRGLRAVSDFEYELQLSYLNSSLDNTIETIFLMPKLENSYISSSSVRALIKFSKNPSHLIPKEIAQELSCTLQ
ncbi:MAG: pantetheine-phosphate adenylyltransferase [Campylobacterota bacterium]|nr:pantetheine-phosphate adenylyltransferase [Campylobacterota bacterium]